MTKRNPNGEAEVIAADAAAALYYATVAIRAETVRRALEAFDAEEGQS